MAQVGGDMDALNAAFRAEHGQGVGIHFEIHGERRANLVGT